jgi:hypothetical protein
MLQYADQTSFVRETLLCYCPLKIYARKARLKLSTNSEDKIERTDILASVALSISL